MRKNPLRKERTVSLNRIQAAQSSASISTD